MNASQVRCPAPGELAALFDDESGRERERLSLHVRGCERCSAMLHDFAIVRRELLPLKRTADVDITEAVLLRLPRRKPQPAADADAWWHWGALPQLGVRMLGGAAALAAGISLGLSLLAGGGAGLGMTVFSAEPAGTLCAGLPSCTGRGR